MRLLIGVLVGLISLSGCIIAPSQTVRVPSTLPVSITPLPFDPVARVVATLTDTGGEYDPVKGFPAQPSTVPCKLPMYTPPHSDGTSGSDIPATCVTSVLIDATTWIVRFTQTWNPSDFSYVGDSGHGPFQHTWEFTIDREGQVRARRHFGQFPPQYVHTPFS